MEGRGAWGKGRLCWWDWLGGTSRGRLSVAIVGHGLEVCNGFLEVGESGTLALTRACCRRDCVFVIGTLVGSGNLPTSTATTATLGTTAPARAAFAITRGSIGVTRASDAGLRVGRLTLRLGFFVRVPRLRPRAITGCVGATGRLCRAPATVRGASRVALLGLTRGGGGSRRIGVGHDVLSLL
jgi:hypothetical protein